MTGRELLDRLRQAGVPEADVAEGILQLCHQLQQLEHAIGAHRLPAVIADDAGEPGQLLDEIAALTADDDDKPYFWDWGVGRCH